MMKNLKINKKKNKSMNRSTTIYWTVKLSNFENNKLNCKW